MTSCYSFRRGIGTTMNKLLLVILLTASPQAFAAKKTPCTKTAVKTAEKLFNILASPNYKLDSSKTTVALEAVMESDPGMYAYKLKLSSKPIVDPTDGTSEVVSLDFEITTGYNGYSINNAGERKLDKRCVVHSFLLIEND